MPAKMINLFFYYDLLQFIQYRLEIGLDITKLRLKHNSDQFLVAFFTKCR